MHRDRPLQIAVYGALGAVVLVIVGLFAARQFSPKQSAPLRTLPTYSAVPAFHLTNQLNQPVSLEDLRGRIWLADIIFTRCPSSCLKMSEQMARLSAAVPHVLPVRFVSLTTDPEFDTPPVLAEYSRRHQADPARWSFLTGDKSEVYKLAVQGLKLVLVDKSRQPLQPGEEMFLHSVTFVLVDARGSVRGYYDSSQPGAYAQILADIKALAAQP